MARITVAISDGRKRDTAAKSMFSRRRIANDIRPTNDKTRLLARDAATWHDATDNARCDGQEGRTGHVTRSPTAALASSTGLECIYRDMIDRRSAPWRASKSVIGQQCRTWYSCSR